MKKKNLIIACAVLTLAGCVSASRIPDEKNPALFFGEASYFATRCPKLQQNGLATAAFTYCLSNKVYAGGCEKKMVDNFFADQARGKAQARDEFATMNDDQVCRIAHERYGAKGSRFAGILLPRKR